MENPPRLVIVFLNTRDERKFGRHADKEEGDQLTTPLALKRWLVANEFIAPGTRVTAADVSAAIELRDLLRALLAGAAKAGGLLTALGRRHPLVVSFEGSATLAPSRGGVAGFRATVSAACASAAIDGSWARLKICDANDCRFVFYDRGRNRLGRWCAMDVCGNRIKTRRHRERQARVRKSRTESR
jgi:predicted RNA-binding Zn ribbon-like protein